MPVSAIWTSSITSGVNRWPAPTCSVMRIAETRSPLRSTRSVVASAPPRMSRTASAASAGLGSRGGAGSLRDAGPERAPAPCGAVAVLRLSRTGFSVILIGRGAPRSRGSALAHGESCDHTDWHVNAKITLIISHDPTLPWAECEEQRRILRSVIAGRSLVNAYLLETVEKRGISR